MAKKVTTIPATINRYNSSPLSEVKKRRVAAYARVSTDQEEQLTSYEAQVDYYTNYIKGREDWEFVAVYTDEGISGCNTKHREGFKRMVADALAGKIDLIITKSVSRFARNTVDSLTTIRQLKEKNIECYFEKENIWTFDGKGELLLTIMSSLAQEESRSISENVKWGHRKRMADGKVSVPFGHFLGYDRGEDGNLVVNPEGAKVVREIYRLFLAGMTPHAIAKRLTAAGIPTPMGKEQWSATTVKSILTNEKYKGDALLQKNYTVDFLTKKQVKNHGEVQQYYVEGNHEGIVTAEQFEAVQKEMERRKETHGRYSGVDIFSSKIICGQCGSFYGSKIWHSNDKYRRVVYQCNSKFKNEVKCSTPHLTEEQIKALYLKALAQFLEDRGELIANLKLVQKTLCQTEGLKAEKTKAYDEMTALVDMIQNCVSQNARVAQNQDEYLKRYNGLVERYDEAKARYEELERKISDAKAKKQEIQLIINSLKQKDCTADEFRLQYWGSLLENMTVYSKDKVVVRFKSGTEITVGIE